MVYFFTSANYFFYTVCQNLEACKIACFTHILYFSLFMQLLLDLFSLVDLQVVLVLLCP